MALIIYANGETRKRDSTEDNILYLSGPLMKQAPSQTHLRRGQGKPLPVWEYVFYCSTAYRTGTEHICVSTLSHVIRFSIPIVLLAVHAAASLWLGHGAHSISIHVVPNLIASCSAFRGSIIPTDPCSGCKVGLLSFQYCSSFKAFVTQYSRHICVRLPVFPF